MCIRDSIVADVEATLFQNFNAGFSMLPVCSHPIFSLESVSYMPPASEFVDVLMQAYQRFQHYDDVFEPMRSLIESLRRGGWDPVSDSPLPVRFRVGADGKVTRYRQLPWLSVEGTDSPELATACQTCQWLKCCGGCEATAEVFGTVCDYRMLFLEFFLRQMHQEILRPESPAVGSTTIR